jgi:hypothetical protein
MTASVVFLMVVRAIVFVSACNFGFFCLLLVFVDIVGGHARHGAGRFLWAFGLWGHGGLSVK